MTLPPRNVWTVHLVSNAAFQLRLYVRLEQCMIRIMQSVLSAQMSTFVYIHQLVPLYHLIAGAMVKTLTIQLKSWTLL